MRRVILIGIPLILIGGIAGYWYFWTLLADGLQTGFDRWVAERRAEGVEVEHGAVEVKGFPYRLELHVESPALEAPKLTIQPAWAADKLTLYFQPWERGHGIAGIEGPQNIAWTEGTVRRNAVVRSDRALASFRYSDRGEITRVDIELKQVEVAGSLPLNTADRIQALGAWRPMNGGDRALDLKLFGETLTVDPDASPFGDKLDRVLLETSLEPAPASSAPTDLDAWRDKGGILQVTRLEIATGDLTIGGDGSFAVDAGRRAEGAASLTVRGADAFVDAIAAAGQLSSGIRLGLRLGIAALEETDAEGAQFFRVPIAIQDGRLKLMGVGITGVEPLY